MSGRLGYCGGQGPQWGAKENAHEFSIASLPAPPFLFRAAGWEAFTAGPRSGSEDDLSTPSIEWGHEGTSFWGQ